MPRARTTRFRTRRFRTKWLMSPLAICRSQTQPISVNDLDPHNCRTPAVTAWCLVSPRQMASVVPFPGLSSPDVAGGGIDYDTPVIPRESVRDIVVGGMHFDYDYAINSIAGANGFSTLNTILDYIDIYSGLVVLPLAPDSGIAPAYIPETSLLKVSPEQGALWAKAGNADDLVENTYERPRVLWRAFDRLKWVGDYWLGSSVPIDPYYGVWGRNALDNTGPRHVRVKAKCRVGFNQALYLWQEVNFGFSCECSDTIEIGTALHGSFAYHVARPRTGA